jgi:hypothetical protein
VLHVVSILGVLTVFHASEFEVGSVVSGPPQHRGSCCSGPLRRGTPPAFASLLFLVRASDALVGDAAPWKVLDTTRSPSGIRRSPHAAKLYIIQKRKEERIQRKACLTPTPFFQAPFWRVLEHATVGSAP